MQAIITGIVCASAVALAAPGSSARGAAANASQAPSSREVPRGGPIRGIAFVLAPDWSAVYRTALRRLRDDLRAALRAANIRHDQVRISGGAIRFRALDGFAVASARASLERAARAWNLATTGPVATLAVRAAADGSFSVRLTGFGLAALHEGFIAAATSELRRRLARSGFDDYLVTDDGGRIRLVIPVLAGPEHAGRQC